MTSIELSGEPMHTCNEELEAKRPLTPEETTIIERYVFPRPLISDEQRRIFNEMKENLKDVYDGEDDVYLLRFLVARCWDLSISEQMFRDTKKWRQEALPMKLRSEAFLRFIKYKIVEILPNVRDRYNRPLVIMTGSRYNPSLNNRDHEPMQETFIWGMEYLISLIRKPFPQFTLVIDLDGWGLRSFDPRLASAMSAIAKPYYPDYMGTTYIINYPWVIWGVWKLAEVLLEPRTKQKIHFVSKTDYTALFPLLFDPDQLYERLGGNAPEKDLGKGEWDSEAIAEWQSAAKLPREERDAFFDRKLEEHLDSLPEEEAAFWRGLQNTGDFPAGEAGPRVDGSKSKKKKKKKKSKKKKAPAAEESAE